MTNIHIFVYETLAFHHIFVYEVLSYQANHLHFFSECFSKAKGSQMGKVYVAIWTECQREISKGFLYQIKKNRNTRISFVLLLLICFFCLLMIIGLLFQLVFLQALSSIILIIVLLVSIRQTQKEHQSPIEQFKDIKKQSDEIVHRFLMKANLTLCDLEFVLKSIRYYRQDRKEAQHTFTSRAFGLLISGYFITGLNLLFQAFYAPNNLSIELPACLCLLSIAVTPFACTLWEFSDSFQNASLARTETMIKALECFQVSR